jgi:hypothetical protein
VGDDDVKRIAEAVALALAKDNGGKCGAPACCSKCPLSPEEHAEQHRAMKGALKVRSVVVVKILEYGAIVLVVWALTRMGFKVPQ